MLCRAKRTDTHPWWRQPLHFITTSCHRREPLFAAAAARDVFLEIFEHVRKLCEFDVFGFVVMSEHVHTLPEMQTFHFVATTPDWYNIPRP
jgi:REP element-mobilizing transposase RayT